MGKLIVFWSPWHGTKVTSSICALAIQTALAVPEKTVALTHAQFGMSDLEGMFYSRNATDKVRDYLTSTGLTALKNILMKRPVTPEDVADAVLTNNFADNLGFYPGIDSGCALMSDKDAQNAVETIICKYVQPAYDYLFVDLASGNNRLSQLLMKRADMVVVMLPQNGAFWDKFVNTYPDMLEWKNIFYLFGAYDSNSRYSTKALTGRLANATMDNTDFIPYDTGYMDAVGQGTINAYIHSHSLFDAEDKKTFQAMTRATAEKLLQLVEEPTGEKQ